LVQDFFQIVLGLKTIQRKGWKDKLGLKNVESVADHSYSMAIMSMVLSDLLALDTNKILKMALLHDLAESKVGDFIPDEISKKRKNKIENDAMKKILKKLPLNLEQEYNEIWNEYQDNKTEESLFLHDIDRLEMAFQAINYSKNSNSKENIQSFIETANNEIKNNELKEIFKKLLLSNNYQIEPNNA